MSNFTPTPGQEHTEPDLSATPDPLSDVIVLDHPLICHRLSQLRDKNTRTKDFRQLVSEIAQFMVYEASRHLRLEPISVETPICTAGAEVLADPAPVFVPILRAGLGMEAGALATIPDADVGHIGLYRNEQTAEPVRYYNKLPRDAREREIFVLDPMVATGGSACDALDCIKMEGCSRICLLCLIAAPEGLRALRERHPDVLIYTCAIDSHLDEHFYIVPGLGDAGDRIFGTK